MLYKRAVLKNLAIFTKKPPVFDCLFNKVAGRIFPHSQILHISPYSVQMRENEACNFIKKTLKRRCFSVNTGKFFKTPVFKNTWLLLYGYTFVTTMSFVFSGNMCLFVLSWRHFNYVIKQVI